MNSGSQKLLPAIRSHQHVCEDEKIKEYIVRLISISYQEYLGTEKHWELQETFLEDINLFVGRNATGKSRTLNVVAGLAHLLTGKHPAIYESGHYQVALRVGDRLIEFTLQIEQHKVLNECVKVDGVEKLSRTSDGFGMLAFEAEDKMLKFQLEPEKLAVVQKQDALQHPYLADILAWARSVRFYPFSTDFGRGNLLTIEQGLSIAEGRPKGAGNLKPWGEENILATYIEGFVQHGQAFDRSIIEDMKKLGYDLVDVGAEPTSAGLNFTVYSLFVVEPDVKCKLYQLNLSQGMFRALALTICLNKCLLDGGKQLIVVDDVGEGLDYRRASAVVEFLMDKIKSADCQLLMSTNDEFTMNNVPLEYWSLLQRKGHVVSARTAKNSSDEFKKFKFMGLNNFDFFTAQSDQ